MRKLLPRQRQKGQTLALFTLFLMFMFIGFLALTIDLGFLYGQRRFDQNSADAATLAVAQYMASNVAPADTAGTTVFISTTDANVVSKARQFAGLDSNHYNQNSAIDGRTTLNVSVEYAADGTNYCYSTADGAAADNSISACTDYFVVDGVNYPPQPTNNPYKVRVIVRSATESFFAQAIPILGNNGGNAGQGSSGCQPAPSSTGMLTCANAAAVINGSPTPTSSPIIPVTVVNCYVGTIGQLYELWGSNSNITCDNGFKFQFSSWASILDLTSDHTWCDEPSGGSSTNPDYKYHGLLPLQSQVATGTCQTLAPDNSWNHTEFSDNSSSYTYKADPNYPGSFVSNSGRSDYDLQYWIAKGFGGTISTGIKLPTYLDANTSQGGNGGQNIAAGFYCGSNSITANACGTANNISGTYFFAQNQPGFYNQCPDDYGSTAISNPPLGCRDAAVLLWSTPEAPQGSVSSANKWQAVNKNPDRVTIERILNFRVYCDHDNNGYCDLAPKILTGSASNSSVWGRFVAPFDPPPATCTTCPPNLNGNTSTLTQ